MLDLSFLVGNGVSKHEAAAFGCMSVEISVDVQLLLVIFMHDGLLTSVNGWVSNGVWFRINSIQIQALRIVSPIASYYAIWVQNWNDLEDEAIE